MIEIESRTDCNMANRNNNKKDFGSDIPWNDQKRLFIDNEENQIFSAPWIMGLFDKFLCEGTYFGFGFMIAYLKVSIPCHVSV